MPDLLSDENIKKAGLTWDELTAIQKEYEKLVPSLEQAAQYVTNSLLKFKKVHSVRYRTKDSLHLIEKIIRKKLDNPNRTINIDNFQDEITDLIGVRALHLFKDDWRLIHKQIMNTWDMKEDPTAYYRVGDSKRILEVFEKMGCQIKEHSYGYRSVHYILEIRPTRKQLYVELQVRTIFEEGWSEIDHKVRYPNFLDNPLTNDLLMILNRLAGNADELSSSVQNVVEHLRHSQFKFDRLAYEKDQQIKQLKDKISELEVSAVKKNELNSIADSIHDIDSANKRHSLLKAHDILTRGRHSKYYGGGIGIGATSAIQHLIDNYTSEAARNDGVTGIPPLDIPGKPITGDQDSSEQQ